MLDPDELDYGRDLILACAANISILPYRSHPMPIERDTTMIVRDLEGWSAWLSVKEDG